MTVHLKGGDVRNRGDVLMLRTVLDRLSRAENEPRRSVHDHFVPHEMRARLGLRQTLWFPDYTRISGLLGYPVLRRYRETLGLTLPEEIDWIFDLSGFCYTDRWGPENAVNMRRYVRRQRSHGSGYVMLPQAFGPFEDPELAEAFSEVANEADLLFARDRTSRSHLEELDLDTPVALAPDLTTIAPTRTPDWCARHEPYVCVVPNSRMVEERSGEARATYLSFLRRTCEILGEGDASVLVLLFEERDRALLEPLRRALGSDLRFVDQDDPVRLRGILGRARGVVASRYHALVSALSQGVVALGTSWSHKYGELLDDYDCGDLLIPDVSDEAAVEARLEVLLDPAARSRYARRVATRAEEMRSWAYRMWAGIAEVTGLEGIDRTDEELEPTGPERLATAVRSASASPEPVASVR